LDEIRIYNRALSADEIKARFSQPSTLDSQLQHSVVAYWPFDDWKERIESIKAEAGLQEPYRSRFAAQKLAVSGQSKNLGGIEGNTVVSGLKSSDESVESGSPTGLQPLVTSGEQPPTLNPQLSTFTPPPAGLNPQPSETLLAQAIRLVGPTDGKPHQLLLNKGDQIVAIGDSITYAGGYLHDIESVLAQWYPELQIPKIINAGIGGQKAENLVARFQKDVVDRHPAIVTLSIGINDVLHRLKSPSDDAILKAYKENVSKMVEMAQAAGIQVILLAPTIIQEIPTSEGNKRLLTFSLAMRGIARDKQCSYVNLREMFFKALVHKPPGMTDNWLTIDGIHMKPLGDAIMALGVLRALGVSDVHGADSELSNQAH